ncbi:MAG TPA: acyl-CoA thioesterase [Usitatibacter sp.]|nr:acyl-CoA thioesterase [Usitatibacter sp.]
MPFERTLQVPWSLIDMNGHLANTGYLNLAIDARMLYFQSQGFMPADFARAGIGPVLRREEIDYFRELRLLDKVRVSLALAGVSPDGARFKLVTELRREDGELCARVIALGGWLDLKARKLAAPPAALAKALLALERTEGFEELKPVA